MISLKHFLVSLTSKPHFLVKLTSDGFPWEGFTLRLSFGIITVSQIDFKILSWRCIMAIKAEKVPANHNLTTSWISFEKSVKSPKSSAQQFTLSKVSLSPSPALSTTKRLSELSEIQRLQSFPNKQCPWKVTGSDWLHEDASLPGPGSFLACPKVLRRLCWRMVTYLVRPAGRAQEVGRKCVCPPGWADSQPLFRLPRQLHTGPGWPLRGICRELGEGAPHPHLSV